MPMSMKRFGESLLAVRAGELKFDTLVKRYSNLIFKIVKPWYVTTMASQGHYGIEDLVQEAWIQVARGLDEFKPEFGVPIERYVRLRIHNKMHPMRERARKQLTQAWAYLESQLVEDKIVELAGHNENDYIDRVRFEAVSEANQLEFDLYEDAMQCMSRVVGELPSVHATSVVQCCMGLPRDKIVAKQFGHCARPMKEYLRAIAGATKRVERLRADRAQQEMDFDHGEPANDNERTKQEERLLRGLKKARRPDAGASLEETSVA